MGLFSLPPAQSRADLNLDMFLGGNDGGNVQKKMRRVMPAEWFPQSAVQLTWRMKAQTGPICCRM